MKTGYLSRAYQPVANAGSKPRYDVDTMLAALGAKPLGLPTRYIRGPLAMRLYNRLSDALTRLRPRRAETVVVQYPPLDYEMVTVGRLLDAGSRLVLLVHDIETLRGAAGDPRERLFERASAVIVHTPAMEEWVRERTDAKTVVLGIFDFITQAAVSTPDAGFREQPRTLFFAGNLAKAPFLSCLDWPADRVSLKLFGVNPSPEVLERPFVDYRGSCLPEELMAATAGYDFGLVWDGSSADTCDGPMGAYLRYNAPFKLTSCLAASVPVIVWSGMGLAPYVRERGLGLVVDSLAEVPARLEALTPDDYRAMRAVAAREQRLVTTGAHYRAALTAALAL